MMTFTYEEDGITVTMETDTTGLYDDYGEGGGILSYFARFLAASGYSIVPDDVLTFVSEGEVVVDGKYYRDEMEELDELREMAKAAKYTPPTDDGWIPWYGGECPVPYSSDPQVVVRLRNGKILENYVSRLDWCHGDEWDLDIVAYRLVDQAKTDDGWIEWRGGEQPVPDGTPVEFRLRDGVGHTTRRSENLVWDHRDDAFSGSDIIAYRVIE